MFQVKLHIESLFLNIILIFHSYLIFSKIAMFDDKIENNQDMSTEDLYLQISSRKWKLFKGIQKQEKLRKAPRTDKIPVEILIILGDDNITRLTHIPNQIYKKNATFQRNNLIQFLYPCLKITTENMWWLLINQPSIKICTEHYSELNMQDIWGEGLWKPVCIQKPNGPKKRLIWNGSFAEMSRI